MSETNTGDNGSNGIVTVTESDVINTTKQTKKSDEIADYVRKQAYEEVSKDMHKFKSKAKDAEARIAEFESKLKAIEEQKLMDEKRYQELYEREKQEREKAESTRKKDRELYLRGLKMAALKTELGSIKDAYLMHADIEGIEVNDDGSLVSDSVRSVANKFRQDHAQLIPTDASGGITSFASPTSFKPSSGKKSLAEMSYEEKSAHLRQIKNNK